MKNNRTQDGSTRRSFMKKSVVAASGMTIFAGLVNAADNNAYNYQECSLNFYERGEWNDTLGTWVVYPGEVVCVVSECGVPQEYRCGSMIDDDAPYDPDNPIPLKWIDLECAQSAICLSHGAVPGADGPGGPNSPWSEIPNPDPRSQ
jgi:hypothetical protein